MKKYFNVLFFFFISVLVIYSLKVEAVLPLSGKIIVIDPGHGSKDPGTSYGKIYEKDINLKISLELEKILGTLGAEVILTRDGDYDLSKPNANYRKKSDFDNRIKLISIHLNYLSNSEYSGPQVFYLEENKELASNIQEKMNDILKGSREIKKVPSDTYMYSKLNIPGVLIECGFLSNPKERQMLTTSEYQKLVAYSIAEGIISNY